MTHIRTIAIDGPSASGKGTIARKLAEHFDFAHLDTGLLYRAVGWQVKNLGGSLSNPEDAVQVARAFNPVWLTNDALRLSEASDAASRVAVIPQVREALLNFQKEFANNPPFKKAGSVLDGRDIGTVILPDADIKFFVVADVNIRAQRRFEELKSRGEGSDFMIVLNDLMERDRRDSNRANAPLLKADDAYILDTGHKTPDQIVAEVLDIIESLQHRPMMAYL